MNLVPLLLSLIRGEDAKNRTFVISLRNIDSNRQLLQQIYEKAESMGFDFDYLASGSNMDSHLAEPSPAKLKGSEQKSGKSQDTAAGKKEKNTAAKTQARTTAKQTSTKSSRSSRSSRSSTSKSSRSTRSSTAKSSRSSRSSTSKSSRSSRSSTSKSSRSSRSSTAKSSRSSRSSTAKSSTRTALTSSSTKNSISARSSRSVLATSKKSSSMHRSNGILDSPKVPLTMGTSSSIDKSISIGLPISSSIFPGTIDSTERSSAISQLASSAFSSSVYSVETSASSLAPTASISSAALDRVDDITKLDQDTVNSILSTCKDCARVDQILVYKDGDTWKDYSGKISMSMKDGKLTDSTGAFGGKECGCEKEDIPGIGKVGETGLYQDKQVSSSECAQQDTFMDQLASAQANSASAGTGSMESQGSTENESMAPTMSAGGADSSGSGSTENESMAPTMSAGGADSSGSQGSAESAGTASSIAGASAGEASTSGDAMSAVAGSQTGAQSPYSNYPTSSEPAISDNSGYPQATEPLPVQPSSPATPEMVQPQILFKAIKVKYDLACDEPGESDSVLPSKSEFKTQTVTIIDNKRQAPETLFKTITRLVVPETVSKTLTQILRAETVTVTEKPDTVIKYSPPRTITRTKKAPPTVLSDKPEDDCMDSTEEQIGRTIKAGRYPRGRHEDEDVVTIDRTVTVPRKGIECVPDCPCEESGTCDNPCMEIRCEMI